MRALLVLCILATTARADVANEATVGSFGRALRSDSANALTEDSLAGPTFGYARRLPLALGSKLTLWGTASLLVAFAEGSMFQTLDTRITAVQPSLGARAVYPLWRRYVAVNATARLDAGIQRVRVSLEDAMGRSASDHGWGGTSTAALGIELMPLARSRFELGLRFELGYVAATGVGLNARSEGAPDDTIELDRMAASLGTLELGGRYASFTVTSRF
jgi:hypothetical protein